MSIVTNAILHYSGDGPAFLAMVNKFFERRQTGFVSVKDPRLPDAWYGGNKYLECNLAIGAFDHLDLDGLVQHLRLVNQTNGRHGYGFQLIVKDQEDTLFRIINIFDDTSLTE